MKLKNASTAYLESKNYKEINNFKEEIGKAIDKAICEGRFECEVSFNTDIPDSIRDEVASHLKDLGYECEIPKHEDCPANCPSDQWRWYDTLKISWERK